MNWMDAHDGSPAQTGYDGDVLVAQVAYYDVVGDGGPGWVGYLHGERVTGRCPADAGCRALVARRAQQPEAA